VGKSVSLIEEVKMAGDKKVRLGGLKVPANPKPSDRYRRANT